MLLYFTYNRTLPERAWHQSGKPPAQTSQNLLRALWLAVTANVFISFSQLSDLISRCRLHGSAKGWKQHHACFMPERESSLLSAGGRQMQLLFVLLLVVEEREKKSPFPGEFCYSSFRIDTWVIHIHLLSLRRANSVPRALSLTPFPALNRWPRLQDHKLHSQRESLRQCRCAGCHLTAHSARCIPSSTNHVLFRKQSFDD